MRIVISPDGKRVLVELPEGCTAKIIPHGADPAKPRLFLPLRGNGDGREIRTICTRMGD